LTLRISYFKKYFFKTSYLFFSIKPPHISKSYLSLHDVKVQWSPECQYRHLTLHLFVATVWYSTCRLCMQVYQWFGLGDHQYLEPQEDPQEAGCWLPGVCPHHVQRHHTTQGHRMWVPRILTYTNMKNNVCSWQTNSTHTQNDKCMNLWSHSDLRKMQIWNLSLTNISDFIVGVDLLHIFTKLVLSVCKNHGWCLLYSLFFLRAVTPMNKCWYWCEFIS